MATIPIKVPGVGESITEGILAKWLKRNGSAVKAGEPLFELETDKASTVVPAEGNGVLKIQVEEGSTVEVGAEVGTLDPDAAPAAPAPAKPAPKQAAAPPRPSTENSANGGRAAQPLSPAVRRLVEEEEVDPSQVAGTGPGGRLTKGDVLAHLESASATASASASATATKAPAREPSAPTTQPGTAPKPAQTTPAGPRETRKRMSGIRQKIAQRLVEVQQTAAILTTFNEADLTRIMDLRSRYKESFQKKHGVSLGFMSFFVKAAIEALRAFPAVNARIEGQDMVYQNFYDVGVAVSTERGLMVPILRNADRMSFAEIEKAIGDFATKARQGTIAVSELQGGSFTITNGGVFGSLLSTPILNPPQSGILGMHSIQKRPVAVDGQVVIRPMMYLALSYDHRIVDGREAVSFLVRIKDCVENPERMMLEI